MEPVVFKCKYDFYVFKDEQNEIFESFVYFLLDLLYISKYIFTDYLICKGLTGGRRVR